MRLVFWWCFGSVLAWFGLVFGLALTVFVVKFWLPRIRVGHFSRLVKFSRLNVEVKFFTVFSLMVFQVMLTVCCFRVGQDLVSLEAYWRWLVTVLFPLGR